jgi:peptidyl-prolyl cis-trans isomerase SurA
MLIAGSRRPVSLLPAIALTLAAGACRPAPQAPPVSPDTWAVVDGRSITREDVDKAYRRTSQPSTSDSPEEVLHAKLLLLDDLVLRNILVARAAEQKIELPEAELDAAYTAARKDVPDAQFQEELTRRKLTAGDMREALRSDLLAQKVLEREVVSKAVVSDAEIAAFFESNRASFNVPEDAVHLAQIVVTPAPEAQVVNRSRSDATTPQQAAEKAQMLLGRLKAGGAFRELAADFSEDAESVTRGGDLGLVPVSAIRRAPAPLRDAVLSAEPGTVRLVSAGGVHTIVLVVSRETAGQRDLSTPEVRQRITDLLRGRREQVLRAAYLSTIRSNAKVVNHIARRVLESDGKLPAEGATTASPVK